jgi:hypothetical protein
MLKEIATMKNKPIYWLFSDNSSAHIVGRPFSAKAIAWKFEAHCPWNYDMSNAPMNYYG